MTSRKLCRVKGLKPEVVQKLAKNRIITCKDLLSLNDLELLKITGKNYGELQEIIKAASKAIAPKPSTAFELHQRHLTQPGFFPTSLQELDIALHGGVACGTVTELTGPAGCGKTQFCIMLSILATLPADQGGLDGNVIYIDTEAAFTATRLLEMASSKYPTVFNTNKSLTALLEKIHVFVETTCSSLWKRLKSLEEDIISHKVKLIVLDSVASLVRKEFDGRLSANLKERTSLLSKEAAILKYLAEQFEIPVVVTNQITTRITKSNTADSSSNVMDVDGFDVEGDEEVGGHVTAALGNTWSHAVNTRLILQYLDNHYRQVMISKSPIATFQAFCYSVKDEGIVLEPTQDLHQDSKGGVNPSTKQIQVRSVWAPHYSGT